MVPHSLDTEEKMKCLYYLYACLDTNAVKSVNLQYGLLWGGEQNKTHFRIVHVNADDTHQKVEHRIYIHHENLTDFPVITSSHSLRALNEMWKCQNMLRGLVKELLDLHKLPVVS